MPEAGTPQWLQVSEPPNRLVYQHLCILQLHSKSYLIYRSIDWAEPVIWSIWQDVSFLSWLLNTYCSAKQVLNKVNNQTALDLLEAYQSTKKQHCPTAYKPNLSKPPALPMWNVYTVQEASHGPANEKLCLHFDIWRYRYQSIQSSKHLFLLDFYLSVQSEVCQMSPVGQGVTLGLSSWLIKKGSSLSRTSLLKHMMPEAGTLQCLRRRGCRTDLWNTWGSLSPLFIDRSVCFCVLSLSLWCGGSWRC